MAMMQVRAFSRTQEILRYILSDMGDAVIVGQEAKVTDTDRIVLAKLAVIAFSTCSEKAESDTPDFAPSAHA